MKTYHFNCGDSTSGPVGLAGSIAAESADHALAGIRTALAKLAGSSGEIVVRDLPKALHYLNFYVSPESIHVSDIDGEDDVPL